MCVYLRIFKPDLDVENVNFPLPFPGFVAISVGFVPPCPVSKRIWGRAPADNMKYPPVKSRGFTTCGRIILAGDSNCSN
jgi:hypothetical protein